MVPVLNHPFLEHTFAQLKQHRIGHIILAMSYLPQSIPNHFGDGDKLGVKLTYAVEDSPLGTAGAVKNAEKHLDSTFVVLNGDIFTDLNIADMLAFHKSTGAKVTISLIRVDNPTAFGVVETASDGRVKRFVEKPSPDQVTTNWINAGIYLIEPEVLKHVPANQHYMFEKGLFPLLLKLNEPIYGYPFDSYWLDMGNADKYRKLNFDLLSSEAKSAVVKEMAKDEIRCEPDAIIHPSVKITGPAVIGSRCRVDEKARIKGPVVIGPDSHIGKNAFIEECIIWQGAHIGSGAAIKQCIVSNDTRLEDNIQITGKVVTPSHQSS